MLIFMNSQQHTGLHTFYSNWHRFEFKFKCIRRRTIICSTNIFIHKMTIFGVVRLLCYSRCSGEHK